MWKTRVIIYPPLHSLLFQLSTMVLCSSLGCVLAMFSTKHANMFVMILKFLLVSRRLVWRLFNLCYRKRLHELQSPTRGIANGIRHALKLGSPIKTKNLMKFIFLTRWLCWRKPWSIVMPSIYVMGGKKFKNYKVMCRMHTHQQFVKLLLKLCFLLWSNESSIKPKDIGYFWCPKCHPFN
jgi:hypothetical protein